MSIPEHLRKLMGENTKDRMTDTQERHLEDIKTAFLHLVDTKYRKGQHEHGGDLFSRSPLELLNMAIDEAIDQVVYLLTLKDAIVNVNNSKPR